MSGRKIRARKGVPALILAGLGGIKSAVAGWFALLPLSLPGMMAGVLLALGLVAMLIYQARAPGDPGGPGDGGDTGQVQPRPEPDRPGGGGGAGGDGDEQGRRGSLEIRFDGPVDLRELRYSVLYHPGTPARQGERLYLAGVGDAQDRVRAASSEQIRQDPARYPALALEPELLCGRGFAFSAASPTCHGTVAVSPGYGDLRSTRTQLRAQASEGMPSGPGDAPGAGAVVTAQATLRLTNTFFALSSGPPRFEGRLVRIEQDEHNPAAFLPTALALPGPGAPALESVSRLELSADRGRMYVLAGDALYAWHAGQQDLKLLYRSDAQERLREAVVTDQGVCVAYLREQQSGMRCLAQDRPYWGPSQTFPRDLRITDMSSAGNALMLVGTEVEDPEQWRVYFVPDASQTWAEFRELPQNRWDALALEGSVGLKAWPGGRQDFLLFGASRELGVSQESRQAFWPLGLGQRGVDGAYAFFVSRQPVPFPAPEHSGHALREVDVWRGVAPGAVRVFSLVGGIGEVDYSMLLDRPIYSGRVSTRIESLRLDTLRLLDGAGREKFLAVAGVDMGFPRTFIAMLRYGNAASPPQLLGKVNLADPAQAQRSMMFQARVRAIPQNTLVLAPA